MDERTTLSSDAWYVEIGGETHEVAFEELVRLASSGELEREDKVRRGNLRWLEAGRVPRSPGTLRMARETRPGFANPRL